MKSEDLEIENRHLKTQNNLYNKVLTLTDQVDRQEHLICSQNKKISDLQYIISLRDDSIKCLKGRIESLVEQFREKNDDFIVNKPGVYQNKKGEFVLLKYIDYPYGSIKGRIIYISNDENAIHYSKTGIHNYINELSIVKYICESPPNDAQLINLLAGSSIEPKYWYLNTKSKKPTWYLYKGSFGPGFVDGDFVYARYNGDKE